MVRVLLSVCSPKKKSLPLKKYAHVRLSSSTFVFPAAADEELKKCAACKVVQADYNEKDLIEANEEWLCSKRMTVKMDGDHYMTLFLQELETLEKWGLFGVRAEDEAEYTNRKRNVEDYFSELKFRLFNGKFIAELEERIMDLNSSKAAESEFTAKNAFLTKTVSEKFDWFKEEVARLLRTPKEISELARATGMNKSNARKWLGRMMRCGIITKTRKRKGVGRPKDIYYLSHRLR